MTRAVSVGPATASRSVPTFARLAVTDPATPERPHKVELAANWRAHPPVTMDIGPVLHIDDVVTGKMSALCTRAEPRDFLDVDAALTTGRYTREQLLELFEQADAGFDRRMAARRILKGEHVLDVAVPYRL